MDGEEVFMLDIGLLDTTTSSGLAFESVRITLGFILPAILLVICNWSLVAEMRRSQRVSDYTVTAAIRDIFIGSPQIIIRAYYITAIILHKLKQQALCRSSING